MPNASHMSRFMNLEDFRCLGPNGVGGGEVSAVIEGPCLSGCGERRDSGKILPENPAYSSQESSETY